MKEVVIENFTLANAYSRQIMGHGGVANYKNNNCQLSIHKLDSNDFSVEGIFECCAVVQDKYIIVIVVYRLPGTDFKLFLECSANMLDKVASHYKTIVIGGDFNIKFLERSNNRALFEGLLGCYDIAVTIRSPTRVTATSSTCVDNIFISSSITDWRSEVMNLNLSDHLSPHLSFNIQYNSNSDPQRYKYTRKFYEQNTVKFLNLLKHEQWDNIYKENNIDNAWNNFLNTISGLIDSCFPVKKLSLIKDKKKGFGLTRNFCI
ncbi:hypothetical protein JTB14_019566 [Gonioctena quinquepunctata]|nr:hypothetical protein JTB14_019566 [Gonioctena quinquepunctata]